MRAQKDCVFFGQSFDQTPDLDNLAERFQLGWQWVVGVLGATVVLGLWRGVPMLVGRIRALARDEKTEEETAE